MTRIGRARRRFFSRLALSLCVALIASGTLSGEELRPSSSFFPYDAQGAFVIIPARIVSEPVFSAGFMAGAILCAPVSIAQDPRMEGRVPYDRQASIRCGRGLGLFLGWPVYAAAGLPFFLLKTMFWDGPRAIVDRFEPAKP